jgi:membrane-associated phospholipid phosphatase
MRRKINIVILLLTLFSLFSLTAEPLNKEEVNEFDRFFMTPYSESLAITSEVTHVISLLSPALLTLAADKSSWLEIGALYASTVAITYGTTYLMKQNLPRERPFAYFDQNIDAKSNDSFPSGHTARSFAAAAYTQMAFSLRYPDSKAKLPVTIATWTMATATAVLRVVSSNHFVTDVLAGAAIGSLIGITIPLIASKTLSSWKKGDLNLAVSPNVIAFNLSY